MEGVRWIGTISFMYVWGSFDNCLNRDFQDYRINRIREEGFPS